MAHSGNSIHRGNGPATRWEIGLTGGIACGKSTLANLLRDRGWEVIDTDLIARNVLGTEQPAYKKVVDAFGPSILQPDKSIDRKVLGRLVFADPSLRAKLNEITHPVIRSVWQREREERARTHPKQSLAVMIPLLFECELEKAFSSVWCVGASRSTQLRRLQERGLPAGDAGRWIESQLPVPVKINQSDVAFWNEGTLDVLQSQLDQQLNHETSPPAK